MVKNMQKNLLVPCGFVLSLALLLATPALALAAEQPTSSTASEKGNATVLATDAVADEASTSTCEQTQGTPAPKQENTTPAQTGSTEPSTGETKGTTNPAAPNNGTTEGPSSGTTEGPNSTNTAEGAGVQTPENAPASNEEQTPKSTPTNTGDEAQTPDEGDGAQIIPGDQTNNGGATEQPNEDLGGQNTAGDKLALTDENPDEGTEPGPVLNGWNTDENGNTYYYTNGKAASGELYLDGSWYHFDESTNILTHGWLYLTSGSKWVYYNLKTGAMVHGESYNPNDNSADGTHYWYYFDEWTGATTYGWKYLKAGAKWVYYQQVTGIMAHGENYNPSDNSTNGKRYWYYFDEWTGATTYGWKYLENSDKWVYYDTTMGWMLYGEQCLPSSATDKNSHWYYFNTTTGKAAHGWGYVTAQHKWCYYDTTMGWMLYGWLTINGNKYNFNTTTGQLCGIKVTGANSKVSKYATWMISIANDNSHGYDQIYRWNERGDYDCSSLVISALRAAKLSVGSASYTGNMRSNLTANGFTWYTDLTKLKAGDILLNESKHTAVYLGDGMLVHASGNENGGIYGGKPGDQTGYEICVRTYYDRPWGGFLRYKG